MIISRIFKTLIVTLILVCSCQGVAMSFFSKGKEVEVVLFSPLEGQLTYQGEPAAGATLELWIAWKDKEGETKTFSADDEGGFRIPIQKMTYKENPLAQLVIRQSVIVRYKGEETLIWYFSKSGEEENSELGGKPTAVSCELSDESEIIRGVRSMGETKCKWKDLIKEEF